MSSPESSGTLVMCPRYVSFPSRLPRKASNCHVTWTSQSPKVTTAECSTALFKMGVFFTFRTTILSFFFFNSFFSFNFLIWQACLTLFPFPPKRRLIPIFASSF
eukprot:Lithocolla_globosa_v1_NODE_7070_length_996_cov_6.668438.p2 type:complete len:104 gc:universal NODE_7070_length_996_cov_6.668438:177-488(+)